MIELFIGGLLAGGLLGGLAAWRLGGLQRKKHRKPPPSGEVQRRQAARELGNFLAYNGDPLPDPRDMI